eukprot:scaffold93309_cov60-Phaeocystis_antarctica.AAC.2
MNSGTSSLSIRSGASVEMCTSPMRFSFERLTKQPKSVILLTRPSRSEPGTSSAGGARKARGTLHTGATERAGGAGHCSGTGHGAALSCQLHWTEASNSKVRSIFGSPSKLCQDSAIA